MAIFSTKIQISNIRFLPDYLRIVCAASKIFLLNISKLIMLLLVNKYRCPSVKDISTGKAMAAKNAGASSFRKYSATVCRGSGTEKNLLTERSTMLSIVYFPN